MAFNNEGIFLKTIFRKRVNDCQMAGGLGMKADNQRRAALS